MACSGFYQWSHVPIADMLKLGQSNIDGTGVLAAVELPKGALVGIVGGQPKDHPTRYSLTVGGQSIEPKDALRMINHSCNPSCELRGANLFAHEEIELGQELTINYKLTETRIASPFHCNCCKPCGKPIGEAAAATGV